MTEKASRYIVYTNLKTGRPPNPFVIPSLRQSVPKAGLAADFASQLLATDLVTLLNAEKHLK